MCLYLTKRNGTYYFRRAIPDELRPAFDGAGGFMFSLRTKDKAEAKRKRDAEAVRTTGELDSARARLSSPTAAVGAPPPSPTPFSEHALEAMNIDRQDMAESEAAGEELSARIEFIEDRLKGSTREMPPELRAFARVVKGRDFDIALLKDQLLVARAELHALKIKREEADAGSAPPALGEAAQNAAEGQGGEAPGVMLDTTIIDLWAAERKVVQKGIDTHRGVVRWFYERVGKKAVDQITRKDVLAFKDSLIADNTAANTNMKLSRLQTLLQYAEDNDYREGNPAKGVRVLDNDAAKNKRKPFDVGSLNAIFSSPVYAENARPIQGKGEAAYWLPLLALFTGARLEELGQLRPIDVQFEQYHDENGEDRSAWFIHIREDAEDDLKLKNAASERIVGAGRGLASTNQARRSSFEFRKPIGIGGRYKAGHRSVS
jgi:hypothetical protein